MILFFKKRKNGAEMTKWIKVQARKMCEDPNLHHLQEESQ